MTQPPRPPLQEKTRADLHSGVLDKDQVRHCRRVMEQSGWVDGNVTAGPQSATVKKNTQLPESSPARASWGEMVLGALSRTPLFISAAVPLRIFPPLFNRYGVGDYFARTSMVRSAPSRARPHASARICR